MLQKSNSQCLVDYTTSNYFCDLDSLYLTAVPVSGTPPFSFIWETGETTQTILIPLALGDYMLTMTDANGCTSIINCHVKPYPDVLYYPYNQNACEGDTVTLFLDWFRDSIPGATYLWSTGETTPTIQLTDDLVWSVTVTDPSNGCEFVIPPGLFDFHPTPYPEIVGPDMICNGETITLSVNGGPFGTIVWYPGGIYEPTLEVTEPGEYIVWGSSPEAGYCWHQDTIVITEGVITPPQITGPPELCAGQTGTVTLTNYALFEEYVWTNGETTSSITVNAPGTYTVTVTSSEGCTATESITIESGDGPELSTDPTAATCGESNGSIDLTATPPQSFDFIWSNGSTSPDLLNVPPGTYSVTVTDGNGCTSIASDVIPDDPIIITISETITHNTSCSNYNGAINLFITPVGEPYDFLWSNGATSEDIDNLIPGTYTVTVSTGVNCNTSASYIIEDNSGAAEILPVVVPASCGESNGAIDIQLNGGQGPFTYLWSNGNTTEELNNIPAGNYTVTVTGADGCVSIETIALPNEDPSISINGIVIPNTSCVASNGEIDITITPPGAYNFNWSNGSTSEDLVNLSGGTYSLTVTLGATCSQTASFNVLNENIPFDITGTTQPNTSCTAPNGSIDITINPSDTYTYLWSTGQTSEDLQNLDQGIYFVTVTNNNGCSITSSFNVISINSGFSISAVTIANTSCQIPNGMIDITINPSGTYTYSWSNGANTEDLQNLTAGTYSVTVTSSNGCKADTSFIIDNQSTAFNLSALPQSNTSCTNPNGSIDLTVNPPGTYSFLWSNGTNTEDLISVNAGVYGVTVTDNNSCSSSASFEVGNNVSAPVISSTITDEVCAASNGSIDLSVTPGGSSYVWSNGSVTEDLSDIPAGTYSVTVTSPNGCTSSDTFTILNTSNNFTITGIANNNNSCVTPNGSIDIMILPVGSYNFQWSTGASTEDLQGLGNGIYQVTVTDATNCSSTAVFTVQSSTFDPVVVPSIIPSSCGLANGSIDLITTPPTGNNYQWSNGSTTQDIFNLSAGTYAVTVTGSNGCSTIDSFTVPSLNSNFTLSGNTIDNTSCIAANGSINLIVIPAATYSYLWSNSSTTEDLQNIGSGTYQVTVTDAFNCSSTFSFTIFDNSVDPELSFNVTPANCGQNNGSIDLTVSLTTGHTYAWSNGATTEDLINVFPGNYSVTVTSIDGCSATLDIDVPNQNSNFSISSTITDDASCIAPSGSIQLTITPIGTYTFGWSNGSSTEDLNNVPSGVYQVTVTDIFNCSVSELFIIENVAVPPEISEVIILPRCGNADGSIDITVNPVSTNTFLWSTGDVSEDLSSIPSGNYSVTVTDINGCSATGNYVLPTDEPIDLTIDADLSSYQVNGTVICSLDISIPYTALDSIIWSPESIMSCHEILCMEQIFTLDQPTQIFVMAMDTNGCMGTASLFLDVDAEYKVYIPNVFSPNNDGPNDRFTVFANDEVEEVVELEIYDRWGNCVFINETFPPNEPAYGWDGVFKNKMMNPAVYAYRAVVRFSNGDERAYKGDVTLVR